MMWVTTHLTRSPKFEVFTPDLTIGENFPLADFGLAGQVVRLPGHSKGSLGILTADGDLFCGDLLYHFVGKPICLFIDDLAAFNASLQKVKQLNVKTIYPGHGKAFTPAVVFGN